MEEEIDALLSHRKVRFTPTAVLKIGLGLLAGSRDMNPMSQGARLVAGDLFGGGPCTPPMSRWRYRTAFNVGGAHTMLGPPYLVPPVDTPGFQDSRSACPPSRQRVTDGQGHQERIDPIEVERVQGEAPHEGNELSLIHI